MNAIKTDSAAQAKPAFTAHATARRHAATKDKSHSNKTLRLPRVHEPRSHRALAERPESPSGRRADVEGGSCSAPGPAGQWHITAKQLDPGATTAGLWRGDVCRVSASSGGICPPGAAARGICYRASGSMQPKYPRPGVPPGSRAPTTTCGGLESTRP